MSNIMFEWDEEKNKQNKKRHGITFDDAKFVFNDPFKIIAEERLYNDHNKQT